MQGKQGEDMSDLHLLLSPAVSSIKAQKSGLLVSLHNLIKASKGHNFCVIESSKSCGLLLGKSVRPIEPRKITSPTKAIFISEL